MGLGALEVTYQNNCLAGPFFHSGNKTPFDFGPLNHSWEEPRGTASGGGHLGCSPTSGDLMCDGKLQQSSGRGFLFCCTRRLMFRPLSGGGGGGGEHTSTQQHNNTHQHTNTTAHINTLTQQHTPTPTNTKVWGVGGTTSTHTPTQSEVPPSVLGLYWVCTGSRAILDL